MQNRNDPSLRRMAGSPSKRTAPSAVGGRRSTLGRTSRMPRQTAAPIAGGTVRRTASASRRPAAPNRRVPSGRRRPSPQRRRHISFRPSPAMLGCIAAVLLVLIYVVKLYSVVGIGTPTYVKNVSIDNIVLTGMTKQQALDIFDGIEQQWLNEVHTLQYQDKVWTFNLTRFDADMEYETELEIAWNLGHIGSVFERKRMIENLRERPVNYSTKITYDEKKVDALVNEIVAAIDVAPVDALVVPDVDAPIVAINSQTGLTVDQATLKAELVSCIHMDTLDSTIPVETTFPAITADAEDFQLISYFATDVSFRNSASRSNVRKALEAFNGISIAPGQIVSFNDIVGPRDEIHGFRQATEYAGDKTTMGWGGGVCQASTTLYNALIMANMTVLERHAHTMTVTYVDPSCDAAVNYSGNVKDLVFQNDTDHAIYIYTSVSKEEAIVKIYGHKGENFTRLESVILEKDIASDKNVYIDDTDGTHAFYTDETALQSKGKPGCSSQGWMVTYDWDTRVEISRVMISQDKYTAGSNVYYRGVHDRAAENAF